MATKQRSSNYLSNVLKSIKYATIEHVADLNPVIVETYKTNKDFFKDTMEELKNKQDDIAGKVNIKSAIRESYTNMKEDLKSGKFYNKERSAVEEEKAMSAYLGMDMSFDFLDDDTFDEYDSDDTLGSDDFDSSDSSNSSIDPGLAKIMNKTTSATLMGFERSNKKMTGALGNILVENSKLNANVIFGSTDRVIAGITSSAALIHQDLTAMNQNIAGLASFANDALRTHVENSSTFYEVQKQQMQEQTDILKDILKMQKKIYEPDTTRNNKTNISDIFGLSGAIDLAAYKQYISENSSGGLGGMIADFLPVLTGDIKGSPLKYPLKAAIKKATPKAAEKLFESVNDLASGIMSTTLLNLTQVSKNSNFNIFHDLGERFGLKVPELGKMTTNKYNKGPTAWTGKDHKALTDVIPKYLADIYSAISGKDAVRYDYERGKFVTVKSIREQYKKNEKYAVGSANRSINTEIVKQLNKINFSNAEEKKQIMDAIEKIQEYNFKKMKKFNPNSKDEKEFDPATYGITGPNSDAIMQIVKMLYNTIDKKVQLKGSGELLESISRYDRELREREAAGDSLFNSLFDDSIDENKIIDTPIMAAAKRLDYTNVILGEIRDAVKSPNVISTTGITTTETVTTSTGTKRKKSRKRKKKNTQANDEVFSLSDDPEKFEEMLNAQTVVKNEMGYTDRIKSATRASDKLKEFFRGFELLSNKPFEFMLGALDTVDRYTYKLFFGDGSGDVDSVTGKIKEGFDNLFSSIGNKVSDTFNAVKDEIKREGKTTFKGIFNAIFGVDISKFTRDLKDSLFGGEDVSFLSGMGKLLGRGMKEIFSDVKTGITSSFSTDENGSRGGYASTLSEQYKKNRDKRKDKEEKKKKDEKAHEEGQESVFDSVVQQAARGLKVTKTGLVAVSKGERIIPDSMDPAAISSRDNAEKTAIGKFKNALGLADIDIENFAKGGRYTGKKKRKKNRNPFKKLEYDPNMSYEDFNRFYNTLESEEDKKEYSKRFAKDFATRKSHQFMERGANTAKDIQNGIKEFTKEIKNNNPALADAIERETQKVTESEFAQKARAGARKAYNGAGKYAGSIKDKATEIFNSAAEDIRTSDDDFSKALRSFIGKFMPEKGSMKNVADDISKNWKKYLPKTLAGGAMGAGISLLTGMVGGPILGAAVGSAIALTSKSNAIQQMLFGEKIVDKDGNLQGYSGNMFSKDVSNAIMKYAPDMVKSGIGGMALSMMPFIPGGPVAGLMIGGSLGYIKNNEDIQDILFGSKTMLKDATLYVKKQLPAMGLGALAGIVTGPFGLTTNMILGSALGLVSDTEKFKNMVFGYKDFDGKRHGGLVGIAKKILAPPLEGLNNLIDESKKFFKDEILGPLAKAVRPIFQGMENLINRIGDSISDSISAHITRPIGNWLTDKLLVPIEKKLLIPLLKVPFRLMRRAGRTAVAPFLAISRWIERGQLNKVGYGSGSASDRIVRRQELIDDYNEQTAGIFDPLAKIPRIGNTILTRTGRRNAKARYWQNQLNNSESAKVDEYVTNSNTTVEELARLNLLNKAIGSSKVGKKNGVRAFARTIMKDTSLVDRLDSLASDDRHSLPYKYVKAITKEVETGECTKSVKLVKENTPNMKPEDRERLIELIKEAAKKVKEGIALAENANDEAGKFKVQYGFDIRGRRIGRVIEKELHNRGMSREEISQIRPEEPPKSELTPEFKHLRSISDDVHNIAEMFGEMYRTYRGLNTIFNDAGADYTVEADTESPYQFGAGSFVNAEQIINGQWVQDSNTHQFGGANNTNADGTPTDYYQYTENGMVRITTNDQGEQEVDEQDAETRETLGRRDSAQKTQTGILGKLSGIGTSLLNFFSGDKEEEKPSLLSRILKVLGIGFGFLGGGKLISALKIAGGVALGSYAWGKLTKEDENGVSTLDKIGEKFGNAFGGVWDKISGWWNEKAIPWIKDDFIPNAMTGIGNFISSATSLLIENLPGIIVGTFVELGRYVFNAIKGALSGKETMTDEEIVGDSNGYKNGQSSNTVKFNTQTNSKKTNVEKIYSNDGSRDITSEIKKSNAYKNISSKDRKQDIISNNTLADAWDKETIFVDENGVPFTVGELASTPNVYLTDDANGKALYSDDLFNNTSLLKMVTGNKTSEGTNLGVEVKKISSDTRSENTGLTASIHSHNMVAKTTDAFIKDTITGGRLSLKPLNAVTKASNIAGGAIAGASSTIPYVGKFAAGATKAKTYITAIPSAALNFRRGFSTARQGGAGFTSALKSGAKQSANTLPFGKRTKKLANTVSKKIGNATTNKVKKIGSKAVDKAMDVTKITKSTQTLKDFDGNVIDSVTSYSADSKIGKAILKIKDAFGKIFGSNKLIDKIYKQVNKGVGKLSEMKEITKNTIKTALSKCVDKLMEKLPSVLADKITSFSSKIAAATATAGFTYGVTAVTGFITGYKNADAIFEVGFGDVAMNERLIAGLLGVLQEFTFGIFDAHLLMSVFMYIADYLNLKPEDLKERQDQLEIIVSAYNDEYGTNFTPYDFVMDDKIETKIMKGIAKIGKTIGSGFLTAAKGVGAGLYSVFGLAGNAVGSLFSDKYGWKNYTKNMSSQWSGVADQAKTTVETATKKNKSTKKYFDEYQKKLKDSKTPMDYIGVDGKISIEDPLTAKFNELQNDDTILPSLEESTTAELQSMQYGLTSGFSSLNNSLSDLTYILNNNSEDIANLVSKSIAIRLGLATADDNITMEELLSNNNYLKAIEEADTNLISDTINSVQDKNNITINVQTQYGNTLPGGKGSGISRFNQTSINPAETSFVSQKYGKFANMTFGSGAIKQTVSDAGCAPTAAMMAINANVDRESTLGINEALKTAGGYISTSGGVTADYFADEFAKHGFKTAYVPRKDKNQKNILLHQLSNGVSVVLMGKDESNRNKKKSPFGPTYHYVVATGISGDGKYVFINDPETNEPNKKYLVEDIFDNADLSIVPIKTNSRIGSLANNIKSRLKQYAGKATPGIIFVGDSRTVGMQNAIGKSDKKIFIAESSKGLSWLKSNIERVKRSASANPTYKIVVNMGVNDLSNINSYISYYKELMKNNLFKDNLYFMSVNPVNESKYSGPATNSAIHSFNTKYKEFAGSKYIDICSVMEEKGFSDCGDGLHYTNTEYTKIYNRTVDFFNNTSSEVSSSVSSSDSDDESTTNTGTTTRRSIKTIGDLISAIGSILSGSYGLSSSEASTLLGDTKADMSKSTISTNGISGTVSSDPEVAQKQKELVAKMKSIKGKISYSMTGPRNPDKGSADCSSTVQWAYKKVMKKDIGSWTGAQDTSTATKYVDKPKLTRAFDESKLQLGDILLYGQNAGKHVEMYYGNGQVIGHGGPDKGPKIRSIDSVHKGNNWSAKRLKEFMPGGKGSGVFVSQNDSKWASKKMGDETVAIAGCAPAVATMAINNTDKYNMKQAIRDAEKYKAPDKGGVSVEYFVDTFKKQGYNTIVLKDKEKILNILAKGRNVVLIGKDENNKSKRRSPFGKGTHYVLATGVSTDRKWITISDPELDEGDIKYKTDLVFNGVMLAIIPVTQKGNTLNKLAGELSDALGEMDGKGNELPKTTHPVLAALAKMTKRLRSDPAGTWTYHYVDNKNSWKKALSEKAYHTNCSTLVVWAFKEAGIIREDSRIFYGKPDQANGFKFNGDTKEQILQTCEIITIGGKKTAKQLIKSGELQPGDVISYATYMHTNVYAGDNMYYDAGRGSCTVAQDKAPFKDWYRKQSDPGKVQGIIRYKGTGAKSKSSVQSVINKAIEWAKATANDNTHGYDNRADHRGGDPDYACSSFVNEAYRQAGVTTLPESKSVYTSKMKSLYTDAGFKDVSSSVSFKSKNGLKAGDVLVKPGNHTELYIGDGKMVGARGNAASGQAENGKKGDQTGGEIAVGSYYDFPWKYALRFDGSGKYATSTGSTSSISSGSDDDITTSSNGGTVLDKLTAAFAQLAEAWGLSSATTEEEVVTSDNGDTEDSSSSSSDGELTSVSIRGSSDKQKIWNYLIDKGVSKEGTAALMGNFEAESGNKFNNLENQINTYLGVSDEEYTKRVDNGTYSRQQFLHPKGGSYQYGYGLAQWTSEGRKAGLYDSAKSNKASIADPKTQMDWLWHELTTDYKGVLNKVKNATDIQSASNKVLFDFESPANADSMTGTRASYGRAIYNEYAGKGSGLSGIGIPNSSKSTIRSINKINKGKELPKSTSNISIFGKGTSGSTNSSAKTTIKASESYADNKSYSYLQNTKANNQIILANNNSSADATTNTLLKAIVNLLSQEVKNTAFIEGIASAVVTLVDAKATSTTDVSTKKQLLDTKAQILSLVRQQNNDNASTSLSDLINSMESIIAQ